MAWWAGTWVLGVLAANLVTGALHGTGTDLPDPPIGVLAASLVALWSVYAAGIWLASSQLGSGSVVTDLGISFRPVDLAGVPIGVAAQLVLVPAVYLPLRAIWSDTFTRDRLEETARDLVDRADGGLVVVLFVLVVVGAPVMEEAFFRGMLQRPLLATIPSWSAVGAVAAVFAAVHFRPLEFAGLFAFGVVLGVCAWRTGRLAMPVLAHVAFNATGLILVL